MMGGGMIWGLGLLWLLVVIVPVFGSAFLVNTCFSAANCRPL